MAEGETSYEDLRAANIRRNEEIMRALGRFSDLLKIETLRVIMKSKVHDSKMLICRSRSGRFFLA